MNKINFDALESTPMQIVFKEAKEVVKATPKSFHPFKVAYNVIHMLRLFKPDNIQAHLLKK
tara:strand:+ start:306 stop:488 length:183 start_codon:yes stop_codon:yes gene_type:complete